LDLVNVDLVLLDLLEVLVQDLQDLEGHDYLEVLEI